MFDKKKEKKNFLKSKKGSHVGVVVSFVTFIVFVVLLYAIVNPSLSTDQREKLVFEYLKIEVRENVSSALFGVSLEVTSSTTSNCIEISDFLDDFGISRELVVRNENQVLTPSTFTSSDNLQIERVSPSNNFFKIYHSDVFDELNVESNTCESLTEGTDYNFGVTSNETYVFEKRILDLIDSYDNYEILKDNLNVPQGIEFGFGLIYENGTILETERRDISKTIFLRDISVSYVDLDGKINSGYLRIFVW